MKGIPTQRHNSVKSCSIAGSLSGRKLKETRGKKRGRRGGQSKSSTPIEHIEKDETRGPLCYAAAREKKRKQGGGEEKIDVGKE